MLQCLHLSKTRSYLFPVRHLGTLSRTQAASRPRTPDVLISPPVCLTVSTTPIFQAAVASETTVSEHDHYYIFSTVITFWKQLCSYTFSSDSVKLCFKCLVSYYFNYLILYNKLQWFCTKPLTGFHVFWSTIGKQTSQMQNISELPNLTF